MKIYINHKEASFEELISINDESTSVRLTDDNNSEVYAMNYGKNYSKYTNFILNIDGNKSDTKILKEALQQYEKAVKNGHNVTLYGQYFDYMLEKYYYDLLFTFIVDDVDISDVLEFDIDSDLVDFYDKTRGLSEVFVLTNAKGEVFKTTKKWYELLRTLIDDDDYLSPQYTENRILYIKKYGNNGTKDVGTINYYQIFKMIEQQYKLFTPKTIP